MAGKIEVFLGGENIISPLGWGIQEAFSNAQQGKSGLQALEQPFTGVSRLFAAKFEANCFSTDSPITELAEECWRGSWEELYLTNQLEERWLFVLSTTKGDVAQLKLGDLSRANPHALMKNIQIGLPFSSEGIVISCACISGISAVIYAADKIATGQVDHAMVVGVDMLSEFTTKGFESFFALDSEQCKPFDANRKGLNLGEAAASLVLSRDRDIFKTRPIKYLSGATSNDANHISGPSRTGEGLFRAMEKALKFSGKQRKDVSFISAHGTGTPFNDSMEAEAFSRAGLEDAYVNSFKGYFGHTLGASGLVEIAMTLQSLRQQVLLKTLGCEIPEEKSGINILTENTGLDVQVAMKTASGFGGCNAAVLIEKM
ncbi:beta-ketoacyl synthase N-terminal-like domain-containing protein [Algoriphagus sp. NG3]|uniref:beta-ketoacyl synthase N-terminal-like domain-containing protein n=1 Tax=Algoriphagus sp. NG3 TaxID=3097546 RepID=UPI002A7F028F|nr:beta-ketoacyl synthase N-terminal-like domain-containing protein [Algoriphagus sp. NG3]WPR75897.1 beta-ketoacyl synthase N-terminal-like domain-containing protein [Algoriphagus sp. NG3]